MKKNDLLLDLISLDRASSEPLYRQVYEQLRQLVLSGVLEANTHLPSTRHAAQTLGISRNTVIYAYEALISDGYLSSERGSGTKVVLLDGRRLKSDPATNNKALKAALSARGQCLALQPIDQGVPAQVAFYPGYPDRDGFPIATWAHMIRRNARHPVNDLYGYHSAGGLPALKEAIAHFATISRGVTCTPEQVIVTAGTQAALDLVSRLVLDPGDHFWIEEPVYKGAYSALINAGGVACSIPAGEAGWDFGSMVAAPPPRTIFLTPSCQWPFGRVMRLRERMDLLELAKRHNAWIIEDDYDSEFRFNKTPGPALQGLDDDGRVIYLGTFSKTMFPALRIGFIVVPEPLIDGFERAINATGQYPPLLLQAALADFIRAGYFAAHLKRMRILYSKRHSYFLEQAATQLSPWMQFFPAEGGMQVVGVFKKEFSDVEIAKIAREKGVHVMPISPLRRQFNGPTGLIFGFAAVGPEETDEGISVLKTLFSIAAK
ncbi:PLP-dependent aminotransferase family protein [Palleronia caenipelagi]|uniref:rhizopine catabolism transcriptional regulator MocR n=1 Tax=Palleronia caenipelagi TaxID=2489174 RepID=UPI001C8F30BC|nr:PLP-dependent aminotransferase family protein [Palleronia caenipelagi]